MGKIAAGFYAVIVGGLLSLVAFTYVMILLNKFFIDEAEGSPPYTVTREATIGQQDRSVSATGLSEYDNSDFLNDMDDIAAGHYTYEPVEAEEIDADDY